MTDQAPELLPCPFCCGKPSGSGWNNETFTARIHCDECGARGPECSSHTNAQDEWNIRADLDNPNGPQFKRMREALIAAVELADACDSVFDNVDAVGTQEFYTALDTFRVALASSEVD